MYIRYLLVRILIKVFIKVLIYKVLIGTDVNGFVVELELEVETVSGNRAQKVHYNIQTFINGDIPQQL